MECRFRPFGPWSSYVSLNLFKYSKVRYVPGVRNHAATRFRTPGPKRPCRSRFAGVHDSFTSDGRYGEILKVVKLVVHTDTYILVKCRWFPLEAALSDAVTQNIYLRTDMPWETKDAFIEAKDINNQVVVAPIPWKPLRLARYTGNKVPLNIRHRTDVLAVVLDRYVDFVGDIGDSSSDDED